MKATRRYHEKSQLTRTHWSTRARVPGEVTKQLEDKLATQMSVRDAAQAGMSRQLSDLTAREQVSAAESPLPARQSDPPKGRECVR